MPELLGEDAGRVAQANALLQTLSRLAYFVGPALGGGLLAASGAPTVLLIDAGSFAVSLLLVATCIPAAAEQAEDATPLAISGGLRFIRRDAWMRPLTSAQALSQAAFMGMTAAIPVLAFATYDRNAQLAGLLLGVWGGGAMLGSLLALHLVRAIDPYRLATAAWTLQALPLWGILSSRSSVVAIVALALSGVANGIRVPPITGLTLQRIPRPIRGETMTAASALVTGAGFFALLAAGPALDSLDIALVWGVIAALQTAAAALFARAGCRRSAPAAR